MKLLTMLINLLVVALAAYCFSIGETFFGALNSVNAVFLICAAYFEGVHF